MSKAFNTAFASIAMTVEFDTEWKNGTGYLNGATGPKFALPAGELAKAIDDSGRRVILVGTPIGNIALFYRYNDNRQTVVSNWPNPALAAMFDAHSALNDDQINLIVGVSSGTNAGSMLDSVMFGTEARVKLCAEKINADALSYVSA